MFLGEKTKEILRCVLEKSIPAYMSYCAEQIWHRSQISINKIDADSFDIHVIEGEVPIEQGQLVGISFQYEHSHSLDRFIFGTTVKNISDDTVSLILPEEIEVIRNNCFIRCPVPADLEISVGIWQKKQKSGYEMLPAAQICQGWSGRLVEVAADSLCVSVNAWQGLDLKTADSVGFRFVPFNHESLITANARVRHLISTAQAQESWLDLEIVGLEASPEGRMILRRICNLVSRYRQMAQHLSSQHSQSADKEVKVISRYF